MSTDQLVQFTNLKRKLYETAANALATANPGYVQAFQQRLKETNDLERAIADTRPLLREGFERWNDLLTAVFDVELAMDKVKRSLAFLQSDVAGTPDEAGACVIYHIDHWTFQMDGFLERLDTLIAKTIRHFVRPKDKEGWQATQAALRQDVGKLKVEMAKVRDPLAHGLGGGVTGIQEQQLWEPFLAGRLFEFDFVESVYRGASPRKQRWCSMLEKATILALAQVEKTSEGLIQHLD
jgi:hypothetical protein